MELPYTTAFRTVVPVLGYAVVRTRYATAHRDYEQTETRLESYFVTPEGVQGGSGEKLNFDQAVRRMIF